ncbi:MAG: YqgE/AlgH family protein [Pseudomonadota bacterium]
MPMTESHIDLTGKVLIAMPDIGDDRFSRSVILICAHAEDFAMGLVLNKPMQGLTLPDLLEQLDIPLTIALPDYEVLDGGPVGRDRGFVLHSEDFNCDTATMRVHDNLCLTATRDVLHAIASETPPEQAVLALGYSGWGPGQIEQELTDNAWLVCDCDADLIYAQNHAGKWQSALDKLGISPAYLQADAGHA